MASSYDDNQNENSSIINNKNSKSPKDHVNQSLLFFL
jgi:hypothetical protein